MKEISDKELLQIQLDILRDVDAFCRKNSIKYTVDGGTCIGAVRHKGYIPWDDDIDIAMTRPNYEIFIRSFNGAYKNLEVFAPELNLNYYAPYANVVNTRTLLSESENEHNGMELGVKIDVFPIDGVATDINEYRWERNRIKCMCNALYSKRVNVGILWKKDKKSSISYLIQKILLLNKEYTNIQHEIMDLVTKYKFEESQFVEDRVNPYTREVRCSREAFEDYMDIPFEDITVSIIKGYDEYLTKLYGSYMQLPPEDQRVAHHGFTAYWKD